MTYNFWTTPLSAADAELDALIGLERQRQQDHIELIASENFVSEAVLNAQGSLLTNKYAEGYPGRRYYGGCKHVDSIEELARTRLKKLFGCTYANVQPHSGSQANQAVLLALLNPGDSILGMDLVAGGHLTHGSPVNLSGKWFTFKHYGVDTKTHEIDYEEVRKLAHTHKPKLIIAGWSAYARHLDFKKFREIADDVGAYLLVDMAHFAGLVATGLYPNPLPHAHVVTSTTHKTLRGPRGGVILSNHEDIGKKINSAVFPGLQGGPLMHVIGAKAVAFKEALEPSYKTYMTAVVNNARVLAKTLLDHGVELISGGTDTHLLLVDLRKHNVTGKDVEETLDQCGITSNKNTVPHDPAGPLITSGIRLGTPAMTTRGFGATEFTQVGNWIAEVIRALGAKKSVDTEALRQKTKELCSRFPIYPKD